MTVTIGVARAENNSPAMLPGLGQTEHPAEVIIAEGGYMKAFARLLVVILLIAGWTALALSLHIVRVPGDWWKSAIFITKNEFDVRETYVDTRSWTLDDIASHPAVVRRIIESGHAESLRHVVGTDVKNLSERLSDALLKGPQTQPTTQSKRSRSRAGERFARAR